MDGGEVAVANNCILESFNPQSFDNRANRAASCSYVPPHHQYQHNHNHHHHHHQVQTQPLSAQHQHRIHGSQPHYLTTHRRLQKHHSTDSHDFHKPTAFRRAACVRFMTRGSCNYGAKCKFSHDTAVMNQSLALHKEKLQQVAAKLKTMATVESPEMYRDPTRRSKCTSPVKPPAEASVYSFNSDVLSEQFPSLTGDRRSSPSKADVCRDNQTQDEGQKLLFKDAVLRPRAPSSPTKEKTATINNQDEAAAEDNDKTEHNNSTRNEVESNQSQSPTCTSDIPAYQRYSAASCGRSYGQYYGNNARYHYDDMRYQKYHASSPYDDNNLPYRYGTGRQNYSLPLDATHHRSPTRYAQDATQHQVYGASPYSTRATVYGGPQDYLIDHARYYSALSRQTEDFVERLDAELSVMAPHQQEAIERLQQTISSLWSDALIEIYGSNYTRLSLPMSDVDCVLVARSFASEPPQSVLRKVADELQKEEWAVRLELLDSAKIPVLKVVCGVSGYKDHVLLDLTCGHSVGHSGLSARDLICSYQADMPALRPLIMVLKSHMQRQSLNCSYTGGLSSYALVLLAIRFLQACGDEHYKVFDHASKSAETGVSGWKRRYSADDASVIDHTGDPASSRPKWLYAFFRDGKVVWRTSIGNLLLLFLETYVTFDYRRSTDCFLWCSEYFALPKDRVVLEPGSVVTPYISDPIKPGRNIGNCFRMHEVIQAWFVLYQQLSAGTPLDEALSFSRNP